MHDFYMVEKVGQRKAEVGQDDERLFFSITKTVKYRMNFTQNKFLSARRKIEL